MKAAAAGGLARERERERASPLIHHGARGAARLRSAPWRQRLPRGRARAAGGSRVGGREQRRRRPRLARRQRRLAAAVDRNLHGRCCNR